MNKYPMREYNDIITIEIGNGNRFYQSLTETQILTPIKRLAIMKYHRGGTPRIMIEMLKENQRAVVSGADDLSFDADAVPELIAALQYVCAEPGSLARLALEREYPTITTVVEE